MLTFGGLSRGMMESTLSNALNTLTGHIQVQTLEYRDDPVIENRIENPESLKTVLDKTWELILTGRLIYPFTVMMFHRAGFSPWVTITVFLWARH